MLKFLNFSLKAALVICVTTLVLAFSAFYYFSSGLPDYKKLANYQPPISSRVYSNDGKLIAEYALEKRLFIPFDAIPSKVVNSFLSAEELESKKEKENKIFKNNFKFKFMQLNGTKLK